MAGGAASIFGIPLLRETYHPWILAEREMQAYREKKKRGIECEPPHRPILKHVLLENDCPDIRLISAVYIPSTLPSRSPAWPVFSESLQSRQFFLEIIH